MPSRTENGDRSINHGLNRRIGLNGVSGRADQPNRIGLQLTDSGYSGRRYAFRRAVIRNARHLFNFGLTFPLNAIVDELNGTCRRVG